MEALEWLAEVITRNRYRSDLAYQDIIQDIIRKLKKEGFIWGSELKKMIRERTGYSDRMADKFINHLLELKILTRKKFNKRIYYVLNLTFIQNLWDLYDYLRGYQIRHPRSTK